MLTVPKAHFPCMEPQRFQLFSSTTTQDNLLTASSGGTVQCTSDYRSALGEWRLITRTEGDATVCILQSVSDGRFLSSSPNGEVFMSPKETVSSTWRMERSSIDGRFHLVSVEARKESKNERQRDEDRSDRKRLACDAEGRVVTIQEDQLSSSGMQFDTTWRIEVLTGELLFLSCPGTDTRVRCNPLGSLSMSSNWKGWEVWRFVEASGPEGHFYVSSWTHSDHHLSSTSDGRVRTTKDRGESEKWIAKKDPPGGGVVIQSAMYGRLLQVSEGGELVTVPPKELLLADSLKHGKSSKGGGTPPRALWHLEPAHGKVYYLSSVTHDRRVRAGRSGVSTERSRKPSDEWRLDDATIDDDDIAMVALFSKEHGAYLASNPDGSVGMSPHVTPCSRWKVDNSINGGGVVLVSVAQGELRCLVCDEDGNLSTVIAKDKDEEEGSLWNLEPRLPSSTTLGNILGITGATLGLAVAAPFAVTGVVGLMGFTSGGITGGSIAAGMMSAEAIASGGGVVAGGTVATLQSIGAVGLGAAGTGAAVGGGAVLGGSVSATVASLGGGRSGASVKAVEDDGDKGTPVISNRPFCAWRSWDNPADKKID